MSRETNSSSSGPQGRGGPPYAPGAEPYGSGPEEPTERAAAGADAQSAADEPKTETTLTTRIRINIPGSRPIPPVVMRKPVGEGEDDSGADRDRAAGDTEPRRGPDAATASGAGAQGAPGAGGSGPAAASGSGTGAGGARPGSGSGAAGGESPRPTSDWFAPRKPPRPAPEPEPDQGRTATPPGGVPTAGRDTPGAGPRGGDMDLLDGPPPRTSPGAPASGPLGGSPGDRTAGPRDGDMPMPPRPGGRGPDEGPAGPPPGPGPGYDPFGRPMEPRTPPGATSSALYASGPGDTDAPDGAGRERFASDTLVSGIPRVPSVDSVFPPDAPPPKPSGHGYFDDPQDGDDALEQDGRETGGRKGKGRSKLVLAAVSLVGVVTIAYGAGLLLDHADVPKGTTVLGVDIGGKTQQDAVNTLDAALESRMTDPLTLVVNGKEHQIQPDILGLTIDTDETVREASGRDYNPVSVIGSLFGGTRVVDAHVKVDEEKLRSAVGDLSRKAVPGGAKDGMVVFTGGTPKVVPGEPHKAVNVGKAADLIEDAYRSRAATGQAAPVTLPVGTRQPKFSEKELQAAADGFGKAAMSGWVWVRAGDVEVPFSEQTIGGFLTMKPGGDTLQPTIDLDKLAATYGTSFDGVVIEGGAGTVPVQPKHVAAAMIDALREPAPQLPEKRVAEVTAARSR